MKRLRTELQQACDSAASEKQEMLQEVQRLTREWQNLSIAAAGDKQELIREIRMLTDEHRKVAEATAVEKQDMHNEVLEALSVSSVLVNRGLSWVDEEMLVECKGRWQEFQPIWICNLCQLSLQSNIKGFWFDL